MTKLYERLAASNCPLCLEALDHIRQLAASSVVDAYRSTHGGQDLAAALDQLQAKGHVTGEEFAPTREPQHVRVFRRAHEIYAKRTGYNIMQYSNAGEMSRAWDECHTAAWAEIRLEDEGTGRYAPPPAERNAMAERAEAEGAALRERVKPRLAEVRRELEARAQSLEEPLKLAMTAPPAWKAGKSAIFENSERYRKGGRTIDEKMKDLAEGYGGMTAPPAWKSDKSAFIEKWQAENMDGLRPCANCSQVIADSDQPAEVAGDAFYPCPHCGHDMFSGEEFTQ